MFRFLSVAVIAAALPLGTSAQSNSKAELRQKTAMVERAYRERALCVSAGGNNRLRVQILKKDRAAKCDSVVDLDLKVNLERQQVIFNVDRSVHTFKKPGTKSCQDPDGDFEHCNDTCDMVPPSQEEGVHGCKLGCLAAYIWDAIWCDAPPVPPQQLISN